MTKQEAIAKACQILRKRVRFKTARLQLPGNDTFKDDTPIIREVTRLYVETWIVPLLDAIESGDMKLVKDHYQTEEGDPIGWENGKDQAEPQTTINPQKPSTRAEENDIQTPQREAVDTTSAGAVLWMMVIETRFVRSDGELDKSEHIEIVDAANEQAVRDAFVKRLRYSWQQILKVERLNAPTVPTAGLTTTDS